MGKIKPHSTRLEIDVAESTQIETKLRTLRHYFSTLILFCYESYHS